MAVRNIFAGGKTTQEIISPKSGVRNIFSGVTATKVPVQPPAPEPTPLSPLKKISETATGLISKAQQFLHPKPTTQVPEITKITPVKLPSGLNLSFKSPVSQPSAVFRPEGKLTPANEVLKNIGDSNAVGVFKGLMGEFSGGRPEVGRVGMKAEVGKPVEPFVPKNTGEALGSMAYKFIEDIIVGENIGVNRAFEQGTKTITQSPQFEFAKNAILGFADKKFTQLMQKLKPLEITVKDLQDVTTGKATEQQRILFDRYVKLRDGGMPTKEILEASKRAKTTPLTKVYDFIANSIENVKNTITKTLTKEEQKLLTAEIKSKAESLPAGTYTGEEVRNKIISTPIQNTAEGKALIKASLEADAQGKSLTIALPAPKPEVPSKELTPYVNLKIKTASGANKQIQIFKNITPEQAKQIELSYPKGMLGEGENPLRAVVDKDGNAYAWKALDATHDPVLKALKEKGITADINTNQSRAFQDKMFGRSGLTPEVKVKEELPSITKQTVQSFDNSGNKVKDIRIKAQPVKAEFEEALNFAKKSGLKDAEVDDFLNLNSTGKIYHNVISTSDTNKVIDVYNSFLESKLGKTPKVVELKEELPWESTTETKEVVKIEGDPTLKLREAYKNHPNPEKLAETHYNMLVEMEIAEPGKKFFGEGEYSSRSQFLYATKSTFPKWIPEDLRSRKLFDKVLSGLSDLENIKYPPAKNVKQRALYNEFFDTLDNQTGIDTKAIRDAIMSYEEKPVRPQKKVRGGVKGGEKPSVEKKPTEEKVSVKEREVKVPRTQLPIGEGVERVSRLEARIKGVLAGASQEQIDALGLSTYNQMNKEETIRKATEYVLKNPEDATKVLLGEIEPPKGLNANSIFISMANSGIGDSELIRKLASLQSTAFGQNLSILTELDKDSPVKVMSDVIKIKEEAFKNKYGGRKPKEVIEKTVKEIKNKVKKPDKWDWALFLDELACK